MLIENCMAIGDRITMVIYIIDFIEVYRYYRYFATTICVREREREREKKGQSRKKFKKKKKYMDLSKRDRLYRGQR